MGTLAHAMARVGLAASGRSLTQFEGLAGLSPEDLRYIVRRGALTVVAIGALIAGVSATGAALQGAANAGIDFDLEGGTVLAVEPTGYAWRIGMRPGQDVVVVVGSDEPGGGRVITASATAQFAFRAASFDASLRASWPLAVGALVFAGLGVLFLRTRRRWVLPVASVALLAASIPAMLEGLPDVSTVVMGSAALVPAGAIALRLPGGVRVRGPLVGALLVFLAAWVAARLSGLAPADDLERVRGTIALWATVLIVGDRIVVPALTGKSFPLMRPGLFDLAAVAAFAAASLALVVLKVSLLIIGAFLAVAIVALPSTRRRFARGIEEALLGDVRDAAATEAAEAERARLARELHDVPLQELVAVIRRLEIKPGTEAESEDLRTLAGHLRNVATELRPPVLDDLGLPAAIDYLAEETTTPAVPVTAEVVDDTGFGAERRPPAAVELAMYRIASEAVGNALRHAGGSKVSIRASVAPDRVDLFVADDGAGLDDASARDAAKHKRLGLASMRRRAQAIDAELSISGSPRGTEVRVVWQA
jgi:signal transduction histidine kinase